MKVTIEKKTDQLNYEDFLGGVTRIVTIAGVKPGNKEQQYDIAIEGDDRVWRPAVTCLKQLILAWTDEAQTWVGRGVELFGDPDVMFGRDKVGGIRIARMTDLPNDEPLRAFLTETRGKKKWHTVELLPRRDHLAAQWKTADPERRKEIEAEVAAVQGGGEGPEAA